MDDQDRRAIEGVFDRLSTVERMGATRDPEAERYVAQRLAEQPGAAYYMAQTIVMQQQALDQVEGRGAGRGPQAAQPPQREEGGGGLLGGLFGRRERQPAPSPPRGGGPWDRPQPGGGGFLAGAAQTAMGVAGGVVLGNMIGGMFDGGGEAQAAEAGSDPVEDQPEDDYGTDDGGGDDFGGGDFGEF